jgi:hypothetical protein
MLINCYESALVGIGLLGASFYTSISSKEESEILKKSLSGELATIYDNICKERSLLYIHGLILGFIIVFLINYKYSSEFDNKFHKTTFFILIILITAVIYYTLMPKSDYILNHVTNNQESKAWLNTYLNMKNRYTIGFILGSLASIPLAHSFC